MTTRAERLTDYLATCGLFPTVGDLDTVTRTLLAIADDRQLISLQDVSVVIGRPVSTIKTWLTKAEANGRRTARYVEPPAVACWPASGPLWDREVVEAWMAEHPEQVRA